MVLCKKTLWCVRLNSSDWSKKNICWLLDLSHPKTYTREALHARKFPPQHNLRGSRASHVLFLLIPCTSSHHHAVQCCGCLPEVLTCANTHLKACTVDCGAVWENGDRRASEQMWTWHSTSWLDGASGNPPPTESYLMTHREKESQEGESEKWRDAENQQGSNGIPNTSSITLTLFRYPPFSTHY